MTKDEYLELLKLPEIPISIWFEYYRERGGIVDDINEFQKMFFTAISNEWVTDSPSGVKRITLTSALHNFYSYYNKKFEMDEYKRPETEGGRQFVFI